MNKEIILTKDVMIETNGYKIYVDKIQREANSNIIKFSMMPRMKLVAM